MSRWQTIPQLAETETDDIGEETTVHQRDTMLSGARRLPWWPCCRRRGDNGGDQKSGDEYTSRPTQSTWLMEYTCRSRACSGGGGHVTLRTDHWDGTQTPPSIGWSSLIVNNVDKFNGQHTHTQDVSLRWYLNGSVIPHKVILKWIISGC